MNNLAKILVFLAAIIFMPLMLWLAFSSIAHENQYLALVRSAFMLLGLAGIGWGLLRSRPTLIVIGTLLVAAGFLTFAVNWDFSAIQASGSSGPIFDRLCRPVFMNSPVQMWHMIAFGAFIANAILIARGAPPRGFYGANLVFVAVALLVAFVPVPAGH